MRVLTFLFLSVAPIWACTCIGGDDPCLDLATPETAVFVGVVIRDSGEGDGAGPGRVRIEEALRGVPQGLGEAEVSTMHGTSCYRRLTLGDRYVFVMPRGQPYGVGGCARSFRLRGNEHKLEALRKAIRNGRESVTGSVRDGSFEPFAGARVELEPTTDGGKSYTAKSGRNGEYTFPKAAPGEYRLQARKRKLRTEVATVTVPARGCAIHDLRVNDDVHFRGRVTDRATGKPFADIKVALYRIDGSKKWPPRPLTSTARMIFRPSLPGTTGLKSNGKVRSQVLVPSYPPGMGRNSTTNCASRSVARARSCWSGSPTMQATRRPAFCSGSPTRALAKGSPSSRAS